MLERVGFADSRLPAIPPRAIRWLASNGCLCPYPGAPALTLAAAATLPPPPPCRRPGATQTCTQKQDHGLETGLDSKLIQVGGHRLAS